MGSFSVYCSISNITISDGQQCVLLPIREDKLSEAGKYVPAVLPIFGTYNDYGGIYDIEENENTKYIEKYFNCTIHDFCHFFTRGCGRQDEDDFPFYLLDNDILKSWTFMFIDREVFDFMSSHVVNGYGGKGYFIMGNESFLKYIGFDFVGNVDVDRYNQEFKFGNKYFYSDGTYLHDGNGEGIYSFGRLNELVDIPEDKNWLADKAKWQVWNLLDHYNAVRVLSYGIGLSYSVVSSFRFESREELPNDLTVLSHYLKNLKVFGDDIAKMVSLRCNLPCMSGYFKPYEPYVTPQCGDYENHQILLEKFAEINKKHIYEE